MMVLFCCYFSCHFTLLWHPYDGFQRRRRRRRRRSPWRNRKVIFDFVFSLITDAQPTHKQGQDQVVLWIIEIQHKMFLQVVWLVQLGTRLLLPPPLLQSKILQTDSSANLLEFWLGRKELPLDVQVSLDNSINYSCIQATNFDYIYIYVYFYSSTSFCSPPAL